MVDRHQLAAILGVHPDRISEYTHAGMPVVRRGGAGGAPERRQSLYEAIECARWVRRHRPGTLDAQAERARRDRAAADMTALRIAERRGELVVAADVRNDSFTVARTVRDAMLGITPRLETQLAVETDVEKIRTLLDSEIREALEVTADLIAAGGGHATTPPTPPPNEGGPRLTAARKDEQ
ncbi:MAG: hypothetical protein ACREM3_23630 [Candidatus Rokuibacteriota bacterium]